MSGQFLKRAILQHYLTLTSGSDPILWEKQNVVLVTLRINIDADKHRWVQLVSAHCDLFLEGMWTMDGESPSAAIASENDRGNIASSSLAPQVLDKYEGNRKHTWVWHQQNYQNSIGCKVGRVNNTWGPKNQGPEWMRWQGAAWQSNWGALHPNGSENPTLSKFSFFQGCVPPHASWLLLVHINCSQETIGALCWYNQSPPTLSCPPPTTHHIFELCDNNVDLHHNKQNYSTAWSSYFYTSPKGILWTLSSNSITLYQGFQTIWGWLEET